ncbi:MAG: NAD-dependent epimerase/dehydratase family protein [Desulfurococcaceae archaeon]
MKILITGGAGFVGGHIAVHLSREGYKVIVIDNLENASMIKTVRSSNIEIIVGDLREHIDLPRVDVIVHASAYISVDESFQKPYEYIVNNTAVTAKIAKFALNNNSYLVYMSSAAVYGNPEYIPISEDHPRKPLSPYGLSKLLGEEVVFFYGGLGLRFSIARLFNVYGMCQSDAYAGVITRFIKRARRNQPIVIYGDGSQTRDFIHVRDVVEFIKTLIERRPTGVFNVGSGRAISISELAKIVIELSGVDSKPMYYPPRPGDIRHSVADIRKAMELGWAPRVDLYSGILELLTSDQCID